MNKKIKEILEIQEDSDYKKLSIEDILLLKECITKLQQCYCNRTDCSGRIKDSKKYDSLQQRIDKAIEIINNIFKDKEWYENYEYNDLQYALEDVRDVLQGE